MGCLCSTILVGTILTLFAFQLKEHINKTESLVTTFRTEVEGDELFDMNAAKQVIAIDYYNIYIPNAPFESFFKVEFFSVEENSKGII